MADLDDFFAKKAKKKTKKKQYTTSSTIAKNVEAQQQAELLREQEKLQAPEKPAHANPEDDKWHDFEEDQKPKEFTGLKILDLKKGSSPSDPKAEGEEQDEKSPADEGDAAQVTTKPSSESLGGPWQVGHDPATPPSPPPPAESEKADEPAPAPAAATTAKYRPGMFTAMKKPGAAPPSGSWRNRRGNKPPDVTSVEDFPSLQGPGLSDPSDDGGGAFERVEGRSRQQQPLGPTPQIKLGNKFDALGLGSS